MSVAAGPDGQPGDSGPEVVRLLDKLDAFPVDRWVRRGLAQCDLTAAPSGLAEKVQGSRGPDPGPASTWVAQWHGEYFGEYAGHANRYRLHRIEPHRGRLGGRKGACPVCGAGPLQRPAGAAGRQAQGRLPP